MDIEKRLFELRDEKYAKFQVKLTPGITEKDIIGVRVPVLRDFAKEIIKNGQENEFLDSLPHKYYDENMLHSILLTQIKDYELCIKRVKDFLPYINNWAVCDTLSPKAFKKNKDKLLIEIKNWVKSEQTYTCRFGLEMLMSHFLDADFKKEILDIPLSIHRDDYYINMMIAWLYATSLAKKWDYTIEYIENKKLDRWVHNKTIQKAVESYRITPIQKEYLKSQKI